MLSKEQRDAYADELQQIAALKDEIALQEERRKKAEEYYQAIHAVGAEDDQGIFQDFTNFRKGSNKGNAESAKKDFEAEIETTQEIQKLANLETFKENYRGKNQRKGLIELKELLAQIHPVTVGAKDDLYKLNEAIDDNGKVVDKAHFGLTKILRQAANVAGEVEEDARKGLQAVDDEIKGTTEKKEKDLADRTKNLKNFEEGLKTTSFTSTVISLTGSLGQLATAFSMIPRFKDIITNEDLSAGEKALQITTALTSMLAMFGGSLKGISTGVFGLAKYFGILTKEEIKAGVAGAAA